MKTSKVIFSLFMGIAMLTAQVGSVLASPAMQEGLINGTVTALECMPATGNTTSIDEPQHPVGAALAAIFSQITDYETIMQAHDGECEEFGSTGFGVIAQALWITKNYLKDGSEADFLEILKAKKTGDFSYFSSYFSGDETPANWGQFKKTMLGGDKKNNLGAVMSDKDNKTNNGKGPDKENKSNNSNKDKDKDKDKNKEG